MRFLTEKKLNTKSKFILACEPQSLTKALLKFYSQDIYRIGFMDIFFI